MVKLSNAGWMLGNGSPSAGLVANRANSLGMSVSGALLVAWGGLSKRYLARLAFFLLDTGSDSQQAVEHFGTFRTAGCKLGIRLLMCLLETVKFVGDVQRGKNGYL
jgi:hypothetical protein